MQNESKIAHKSNASVMLFEFIEEALKNTTARSNFM